MRNAVDLAQDMVESTTEYDLYELPDPVRQALISAARTFLEWSDPMVIVLPELKRGEIIA